jgi:hypothetical protein
MIHNLDAETQLWNNGCPQPFFTKLQDAEMNFYLTGSVFFGNAHAHSDWDFFIQGPVTESDAHYLLALGFNKEHKHPDELFGGVTEVWSFPHPEVHILVVNDIDFRNHVQNMIKEYFPTGYNKHNAHGIWHMACALVKSST